ncbi:MAG: CocE/NonD family hydrolase [Anaerolineae bacterium]|nr:CocE/NonD family hydrolase [Anaerolineae bacterium]
MVERDVAVPMRDGVILRANIFRPDGPGPYPALVHRTPYGKATGGMEDFVRAGYGVISQDVRGRYASDGDFVLFSSPNTGHGEDGYDTVEWTASLPWCSGKIGTFGVSYDAWMQYECAKLRPPHLEAMSAISIPMELTDVDFPGAFKPARRVRWWLTTIAPDMRRRDGLTPPHTPEAARLIWDKIEQGLFLGLVPWGVIPRYLPPSLAQQVADWLEEPYRKPWRFDQAHSEIAVPNLDFTGWYDHCCSIDHLAGLQHDARGDMARIGSRLLIGPWNHTHLGQRQQGDFDFGPAAAVNIRQMQIRWFDYWLKLIDNDVEKDPPVRYFVMGTGQWHMALHFPPNNVIRTNYYLSSRGDAPIPDGSGTLKSALAEDVGADTFTYDPHNPVPTLWESGAFYNVSDRRQLDYRTDILHYRSPVLTRDLEIVGKPEVILYASTSARDTDFFVRLSDETPDGPAMEICYGMVRARYRHGMESEELVEPGAVVQYSIIMGYTACVFRKGHRIRLEITSSDFPNHDRNHNTGKNDLFDAEMKIAKQVVFHSVTYPSALVLPEVGEET